ncbi:TPA: heme/hemoglobin uptake receptor PhuR [Pseudomonas aeruginosa]|uniref:heme/hemoglobin uptake receptor PhuR n=1 Tax=Pseudomonas aeruginosa TaxID=287 RepID=UPI00071B9858|nr:heme/hemoglobin uptake receptor PhuR [Pseudomonas aeruginosa]AZZ14084.1 TonB-dependent hemoglobin/transferrin/lactoferrin family receptor [Pseudomonas aeruginosa]EKN9351571.1 heme/hemoglobin uptake receptor PhuR [Pseudomonas aeruginosa]KSJ39775.1 TonB-dependent receptor [Pseudomonas aeruginosa]MBG5163426.1 heme/hemoglobin uptake receptor PhuR [Pseudomonas aeruginosa]MBS9750333.1 heme/hemoglobin uptake receptor PhuR [Pseudomonas aeruginosa]
MPLSPPFALRPCLALLLLSPSLALAGNAVPLTPTTITATRTEQAVDSVPSTVSVQTREQLDRQNVNNIKELVRYEPGVSVGGAGQRAGITGYNIRGIDGNRILTQIDGVELPNDFFSGPYAQTHRNYVDPDIVKRVEILRGPASALYGSNAIGGAVSYFTLDPSDIIKDGKDVGARLKAGYESASHSWLTSATVAGRADDFDGLLHYGYRQGHETESNGGHGGTGLSRSEANPEDADSYSLLGKLGWNYAEGSRFGLVFEKYKSDVDTDQKSAYGGPYDKGKPAIPPSMLPGGMYQWRKGNDTLTRERYGLEHHFLLDSPVADRIQWSLNYQLAKTDQATREFYYPITRKVLRTRDTTYKERLWVFDSQLDKSFAIGETEHLLSYGINLKHQKVTGMRSGTGTNLDTGADSPRDALERSSDFPDPTVKTYALFAQDSISWNDWTFTPGLRYDYTRMEPHITDEFLRTMKQSQNTAVDESDKKWHRVSPKFGVTYDFAQHYTWYGQYAQGFRTPTAKALYGRFENLQAGYHIEPNPNLKPEKSQSFETGLRGKFDEGSFGVAVFYNKYRDFIDEDALNTDSTGGNGQTFQSNNIERAVIKGVELKGRLELGAFGAPQGLYTQGSVAYAYGRNKDNGEPINSVNPLTGVFGLGYDEADGNYGGLLSWTLVKRKDRVDDSTFHTPDGTASQFKTPGFGVLDLSAYYRLSKDLTLNAGLYNLTDEKYWLWDDVRGYDSVGEASALAPANIDRLSQPGRNFAVNLVWDI